MASTIDFLMDSAFFQRLVAERGLTSAEQVAALAQQLFSRPDFDFNGAMERGDVTAQSSPPDFLRAVHRPMLGDGGGPAGQAQDTSPTPGQQVQAAQAATDRESHAAVSDWAAAVTAGDFGRADRALSNHATARGAADVQAPTVNSLAQAAIDAGQPGQPLSLDDVTRNVGDKISTFFSDLGREQPGFSPGQKRGVQVALGAIPGIGPAVSTVAGFFADYYNTSLQNQKREALGLPQLEFNPFTTALKNLPVVGWFTDPVPSFPTIGDKSYFGGNMTTEKDPEINDRVMGALATGVPGAPGVSISRSPPPGFERSLSPPPGTGWAEEDPQPKTAAQLAAKGRTPAELSKWGFTDEEIGNVFGSFNANWGGPPLDELIGLFGWGGWDSNGGTNTDTPGGWGPGTDSESNMSGFG